MNAILHTTNSGASILPYDVLTVKYLDDLNGCRSTCDEWMDYSTIRTEDDARTAAKLVDRGPNAYTQFQIVRRGVDARIIYG